MSRRLRPHHLQAAALLAVLALAAALLSASPAAASARSVSFDGKRIQVPASWPVYRLAQHPGMCVRLDRRAVYLGTPAAQQRCPATVIGKRRAILVEPQRAGASRSALPRTTPQASASAGGAVFTGLGFDACTAPSQKSMSAWRASSPYEAIGVYIGGSNRGCSQPNLTASWVTTQTAAGWHLIPTYVGLQAPTSACSSCAKLNSNQATAQGAAAATDAVTQAGALGMGPGSPIYFDMEAYTRTSSATAATLAFLESWTEKLHALGYSSGVYSSSASGIADLAGQVGSGYTLPDDIWFANWNGVASTSDPYVPANAWSGHQRIHQYRGGHDETYGGVTINIDNNYVDGSTVGSGGVAGGDDPIAWLDLAGAPAPAQVRVKGWAFDPNQPTVPLSIRLFVGGRAGSPNALEYELGPVANLPRPDLAAEHPEAGPSHGFDVRIPTIKSGPQPVCAYAIDVGRGDDRLIACKTTHIPVGITLSNVHATRNGVRARIACAWPAGTPCPGQLALRTRFKVSVPRGHGRPPRLRTVKRSLARRTFQLVGSRSQAFTIPLSPGGRELLRLRGTLRTQLVAAIPGGRRVTVVEIERR
ncbi:MAG TPA: DUF1906 domain-containing protein [Solirubrobacterales bacterium]|jgi:hypothetical protein|nr:DUF1906 domain-containing protein [Solirubrobacterales bacterium]